MSDIRFRLTNSQRQLVDRRRRGETQEEAARRHGVSEKRYRGWELGRGIPPFVSVQNLKHHERCYLLRLESTLSQQEVAWKLGCSRVWINRMELGLAPVDVLMEYWDGK